MMAFPGRLQWLMRPMMSRHNRVFTLFDSRCRGSLAARAGRPPVSGQVPCLICLAGPPGPGRNFGQMEKVAAMTVSGKQKRCGLLGLT